MGCRLATAGAHSTEHQPMRSAAKRARKQRQQTRKMAHSVSPLGINVSDVDLHRAVILGLDQAVGGAALARDVQVDGVALCVLFAAAGRRRESGEEGGRGRSRQSHDVTPLACNDSQLHHCSTQTPGDNTPGPLIVHRAESPSIHIAPRPHRPLVPATTKGGCQHPCHALRQPALRPAIQTSQDASHPRACGDAPHIHHVPLAASRPLSVCWRAGRCPRGVGQDAVAPALPIGAPDNAGGGCAADCPPPSDFAPVPRPRRLLQHCARRSGSQGSLDTPHAPHPQRRAAHSAVAQNTDASSPVRPAAAARDPRPARRSVGRRNCSRPPTPQCAQPRHRRRRPCRPVAALHAGRRERRSAPRAARKKSSDSLPRCGCACSTARACRRLRRARPAWCVLWRARVWFF